MNINKFKYIDFLPSLKRDNYEIYEIIVKKREKGKWTYKLYNIDDGSITIKNHRVSKL